MSRTFGLLTTQNAELKTAFALVFLLAGFFWTSFYGLNFGTHWDENRAKFDSVRDSLRNGLLLQGAALSPEGKEYNHGGLNYLLIWAGLTPEVLRFLIVGPHTLESLSRTINPILYTTTVRVRVRAIYVVLSGLCIVWSFGLVLLLGRSRMEALLAAALLSCSWEFAYHSRWIAPDAVMAQFLWLSLLCLVAGEISRTLPWFYLGAVAMGLAVGTKYTAALLLPFFVAGAGSSLWRKNGAVRFVAKNSLGIVLTATGTFVLTTPGSVLDPFRFFYQLGEQQEIYGTGWYGYSVKPGVAHFLEILKYFTLQFFSHFGPISAVLAVFSLLGLAALLLERKPASCLLAAFCFAYLVFFSLQSALIVRNLLVVVPFLSLAAARGITVVAHRFGRNLSFGLYAAIGVLLAANFGWEVYAARQIKLRNHPEYFLQKFRGYVEGRPNHKFLVSARLFGALRNTQAPMPANMTADSSVDYTKIAFFQTEGADTHWETWPSNVWGLYERIFGPQEVNLEAYTTFIGNERIIVITKENFRKLPLKDTDLAVPQ